MWFRLSIFLLAAICISACSALAAELSDEMAPQISTEVAIQVGTAIAGISADESPSVASESAAGKSEIAQVTRVIDGDTIDVLLNGKTERIRYVQINTPERDEPCFAESTQANADLVADKTVRLVHSEKLTDPFGRLLHYVYVGDIMVERVLVEQGFAEVVLYPPNDRHYDEFLRLETEAAAAGRGCHPTGIFDDGSTTR